MLYISLGDLQYLENLVHIDYKWNVILSNIYETYLNLKVDKVDCFVLFILIILIPDIIWYLKIYDYLF